MFSDRPRTSPRTPNDRNDATDKLTISTPNEDIYEKAQDTLRSLREDIAIFRDPQVRHHLDTIPLQKASPSAPNYPLSKTPEQLNAIIIDLRTSLNSSNKSLKLAKEAEIASRKRAARAEGQVEELRNQFEEESQNHAHLIKNATERIQKLEKENEAIREMNEDDIWSIKQSLELDRYGNTTLEVERDTAMKEADKSRLKIESLEEELEATKAKLANEKKINFAKSQQVSGKLSNMERELGHRRRSRLSIESKASNDLNSARELNEKLQQESSQLKSDLEWQTSEANTLRAKLSEAEESYEKLKKQYTTAKENERIVLRLKRENTTLRKQMDASSTAASQIDALSAEKHKIIGLISGLSPTGDIHDGLKILENFTHQAGKASSLERISDLKTMEEKHHQAINEVSQELNEKIQAAQKEGESYQEQLREAQGKLAAISSEKESLADGLKRKEVVSRILEKKINHYKAALDEITVDVISMTTDSSSPAMDKLKSHFENIESVSSESQDFIKQLEKTLAETRAEIHTLKEKLASADLRQKDQVRIDSINNLKNQLQSRSQLIAKAHEERERAETEAHSVRNRLAEVEEELTNLKLRTTETVPLIEDGPADFDSQKTRVLHFKENPLALALRKAQENKDATTGKKRLRLDVDLETSPARGVDSAELLALKKRIEELVVANEELQRTSKIGARTGEIARKKIEEVRVAVYTLFGWSMRMNGANYNLSSIYAEGPGDQLMFGINEKGGMSLMETEYAAQLTGEIEEYVGKMGSIPALLAHITMDNFAKTTAAFGS